MSRFHSAFKETGLPRSLPSIAFITDSKEAYEHIITLEETNLMDSFTGEYGITGSIINAGEEQEISLIYYPSIPSLTLNLLGDATTAGVRILFKLGTAFSVTSDVDPGTLVIVRSAVREDFITDFIIDSKLPAIPDFDLYFKVKRVLTGRMLQATGEKTLGKIVGCVILSLGYIGKHLGLKNSRISELIKNPRICAIDMDTSVIYSYSYLRNLKAVSILAIKESFSSYSTFDLMDISEQEESKKKLSESISNIYMTIKDSLDYMLGSEKP